MRKTAGISKQETVIATKAAGTAIGAGYNEWDCSSQVVARSMSKSKDNEMKTLSTAIWIELITARLPQISPAVLATLFIRIINTCLEAAKENKIFYVSSFTIYRAQKRSSLKVHQRKFAVFAV